MAEKKMKIKISCRENDGCKDVSIPIKKEVLEQLDELSAKTNRSRNELINLLLDSAIDVVIIEQ